MKGLYRCCILLGVSTVLGAGQAVAQNVPVSKGYVDAAFANLQSQIDVLKAKRLAEPTQGEGQRNNPIK